MYAPLQTALEAAHRAGVILRRKFTQTRQVKSKGLRDIVTDADFAAQQAVTELIAARFPDHTILSEEGVQNVDLNAPAQAPIWVIDPLDGTTNYSRQFPSFCVVTGLIEAGETRLGVIYDPLRGETFFGESGKGAFVQTGRTRPRPLRISDLTTLKDALVGVDWARDPATRQRVVDTLGRVAPECRTIRAVGSAALSLAYVAAGRLDGYYHLAIQPWDVVAGALMVREAGGKVSAADGRPWSLTLGQVVASNGHFHDALLKMLALG
jgi:myo-inositol-1(or 4)-monophosphatase